MTVSRVLLITPTENDLINWLRRGWDVRRPQHEGSYHHHHHLRLLCLLLYREKKPIKEVFVPPFRILLVLLCRMMKSYVCQYSRCYLVSTDCTVQCDLGPRHLLSTFWSEFCLVTMFCHNVWWPPVVLWLESGTVFACSTHSPASNADANVRCWRLKELLGV